MKAPRLQAGGARGKGAKLVEYHGLELRLRRKRKETEKEYSTHI
jgi:hypothetical protein